MTRVRFPTSLALLLLFLLPAACGDLDHEGPLSPADELEALLSISDQPVFAQLTVLVAQIFPTTDGLKQEAGRLLQSLNKAVDKGEMETAEAIALQLVALTLESFEADLLLDPPGDIAGSADEAVGLLINGVYDFAGLEAPNLTPEEMEDPGTVVEFVGPEGGDVTNEPQWAGVNFPEDALEEEVLVILAPVDPADFPDGRVLPTDFPQYGPFYSVRTVPEVMEFNGEVVLAVCWLPYEEYGFEEPAQLDALRYAIRDPDDETQIEFLPPPANYVAETWPGWFECGPPPQVAMSGMEGFNWLAWAGQASGSLLKWMSPSPLVAYQTAKFSGRPGVLDGEFEGGGYLANIPDLRIDSLVHTPDPVIEGQESTVTVYLVNTGLVESPATTVRIFLDGDPLEDLPLEALDPDSTEKVVLTTHYTFTASSHPLGLRVLSAVVDPDEEIWEQDEELNELFTPIFVNPPLSLVTVSLDAPGDDPAVVATLEEAMAIVAPDGTIFMDEGTHIVEDVVVDKPVTIDEVEGVTAVIQNNEGLTSLAIYDVASGLVTVQNLDFVNNSPGWLPVPPYPTPRPPRTSSIETKENYDEVVIQNNTFFADISVNANSSVRIDTVLAAGSTVDVIGNDFEGGLVPIVVTGVGGSPDPGLYPANADVHDNEIWGSIRTGTTFQSSAFGEVTFNRIHDIGQKCIQFDGRASGTIADNELEDCGTLGAIRVFGGTVEVLRNNITDATPEPPVLPGPSSSAYHDLILFSGSSASGTIADNVIDGCGWGACISVVYGATVDVHDNDITAYQGHRTAIGIVAFGGEYPSIGDANPPTVTIADNDLTGMGSGGGDPLDENNYPFYHGGILIRNAYATEVSRNAVQNAGWGIYLFENGFVSGGSDNEFDGTIAPVRGGANGSIALSGNDFTNWQKSIWDNDNTLTGSLSCNWWGDAAGPYDIALPPGSPLVYAPWAIGPIANGGGGTCTGGSSPDPYEPNNDPAGGWNIDALPAGQEYLDAADGTPGLAFATINDPILGTPKITAPTDIDYFRFTMPDDNALLIQMEHLSGAEELTMDVTDVVTGETRHQTSWMNPGQFVNTVVNLEGGREYSVAMRHWEFGPFSGPHEYQLVLDPQPISNLDYLTTAPGINLEPNDFDFSASSNSIPAPPFSASGRVFSGDGHIGDVDSYNIQGGVGTHVGFTLENEYSNARLLATFGWRPNPDGPLMIPDRALWLPPSSIKSHVWPIEVIDPHYLHLVASSGNDDGTGYDFSAWVPEEMNQISSGTDHSCGVDIHGDAMCWGRNLEGQLGVGGGVSGSPQPIEVMGAGLVQIDAGFTHSCGVDAAGNGYCWGVNTYGQLGDGTTTSSAIPVPITGGHTFVAVEAGGGFSCGIDTTGDVLCWGDGSFGKLGDGTGDSSLVPVPIPTPGIGIGYQVLSVGNSHSCAHADTQHLWCWGDNGFGQLGDGTSGMWSLSPVRVGGLSMDYLYRDVSVGFNHTCGLEDDDDMSCWGNNTYGQLGDETTTHRSLPVLVTQGNKYHNLNAAQEFTCGVTDDSGGQPAAEVHCFGRNDSGQLGDGTLVDRHFPLAIIMDSNRPHFYDINGGAAHTCAISVGNVAWCWGHNASGQLGDGTYRSTLKPTAVRSR